MRRGAGVAGAVAAVLLALASLYTLRPLWFSERMPVAQVLALKGTLAATLLVLGLLLVFAGRLVLLARQRRARVGGPGDHRADDPVEREGSRDSRADRSRAPARPVRGGAPAVVVLAGGVVAALAGVAHGVELLDRGVSGEGVTASDEPPTPERFTVLTLNTLGGAATPTDVVDHAVSVGADVLALPETSADLAEQIVRVLEERTGQGFTGYTEGTGAVGATSMVVADALGPYEQRTDAVTGGFGRVHLRPTGDDPDQPVLVAAHPIPPVAGNMAAWRAENRAIMGTCERAMRPTVIAGDLNMTLDHASLTGVAAAGGRCHDAGVDAGIGGLATWPASWPVWAGATIDHVLVAGGLRGTSGQVEEVGGSDHRAVAVELRLTAPSD
ncbi:endonuclease/exonuclease/phosphatase family protein [Georgenia sp. Z1491]|uniref:endonuclease/exonuclease/phosphatase family protein n=1 Tax=Georgenia sp. Z1491 TaxID=3416707 RepID=UPI003CF3A42D